MKLWLLTHVNIPVIQGGAKSSHAEVAESRISEDRMEFKEVVDHHWSEMEISYSERDRTDLYNFPQVRRATTEFLRLRVVLAQQQCGVQNIGGLLCTSQPNLRKDLHKRRHGQGLTLSTTWCMST